MNFSEDRIESTAYLKSTRFRSITDLCILNIYAFTFSDIECEVEPFLTFKHIEVRNTTLASVVEFRILRKEQIAFFLNISQHGREHDCVLVMLGVVFISVGGSVVIGFGLSDELASDELPAILSVKDGFWVNVCIPCILSFFSKLISFWVCSS